MNKILLIAGVFLFQGLALAAPTQMPQPALQGKFSFHGRVQIDSKVRTVYLLEQTQDLDQVIMKYVDQGYICEALENGDYECGRGEDITAADAVWADRAQAELKGQWLKFEAPTEPPVLDHDYGGSTVWAVTQDVTTWQDHVIPETQYSFAGNGWNNLSFFDSAAMTQNDFQILSDSQLMKSVTYEKDENGTHLEVTVNCFFGK
jgi:hypothetical protein